MTQKKKAPEIFEDDPYYGETMAALGTIASETMNMQYHSQNISKIIDRVLREHFIDLKKDIIDELAFENAKYITRFV